MAYRNNSGVYLCNMKNWKAVGVKSEDECINIDGVNFWYYKWIAAGQESIQLPHPKYPGQMHAKHIFKIATADREILFATGELSAKIWGFYVLASLRERLR